MGRPRANRLRSNLDGFVNELQRSMQQELRKALEATTQGLGEELKALARQVARLERKVERLTSRGRPRREPALCSREGCGEPVLARGLCSKHYQRMRYHSRKDETPGEES